MFSIKSSFANCSECLLLSSPSCILETNCKKDLSNVDVVFVAENPGKEEVKRGVPLIGKAGKMFRKYFTKYDINKMNYLLTNVVLCQTLNEDGTTGNPDNEVIENCKINCINIIKTCNPKLVVLMGTSPMSAFGIAKSGITNMHGKVVQWDKFKTMVIVHPSFVNRNIHVWEPKFENAFEVISNILQEKKNTITNVSNVKAVGEGIHRYKIPDQFYTDKYRLVDVQFLNKSNQVLYIFRDNENNKVYHKISDQYVCYQIKSGYDAKKIVPYDDLNQISIRYRDRYNLDPEITYEGDIRITTKHAMDYYFYNKGEAKKVKSNIMFFDIEVDTGEERVFPHPTEAKFPINMITTIFNDYKICYVLDNFTEKITQKEVDELRIFNTEKELMQQFIKQVKVSEPDFMAGWNCISFDLEYIFNRLPQIGIKQDSFTKFGEFYVDSSKFVCNIPGSVAIDQDFLYRTFTFTKMENYKLGFIAQHELGITKLDLPLPFNEMYWKMLNKTIEYNIRDTELLQKLDDKLSHINLLNELRVICNTTFNSVSSFGQIDSLIVSYLKNKGLSSKNADPHISKEKYPGAFVFEPTPGVYNWITDFDFASLYPSLMITYNIGINSYVMKTEDPHLGYELTYHPESLPNKIKVVIDPLYKKQTVEITPQELHKKIKDFNLVWTINGCFFKDHKTELSVFAEIVDILMSSRKDYKKQMFGAIEKKDREHEDFFYTRQLVYKVLANTLYGIVANKSFRFFDLSLAAAITLSGQEALKTSIIEADAFMKHLDKGIPYESPTPLTKQEMFENEMPNRSNEYIITGDTDSIFCKFGDFKREVSVKKIQTWCSQIEEFLNETKIVEVVKKHNGDLNFNRLKLKNELVISRGLFLAKKRYAIRVINNEGKDVDKINYMGVEIKRSDYPQKSKEFLSELSELILKDEKFKLIKTITYVKRKELEFKNAILNGEKSIARPVSYAKKLSEYKTITQAVKAMEAWNQIMYNIHNTGAKAYMYWVSGIDFDKITDIKLREEIRKRYDKFIGDGNKLEVIAIPDEESRLPNFFIPDLKAALKFSFQDRHDLMLKPLTDVKDKLSLLTV